MVMRGWLRRRALGALVASAAMLTGAAAVPAHASAAVPADAADDGDLIVEASPHPTEFFDMSPGERRYWSVQAQLLDADRGSLALLVFGAGPLIEHPRHGLLIAVDGCDGTLTGDDPRVRPECSGEGFTPIIAEQSLAAISTDPSASAGENVWPLPDIVRDQARSFVVTLSLPAAGADDKTLMGLRGQIGVGLYAAGDAARPGPGPDDPLPPTGAAVPLALLLLGGGAAALGLALARMRRPRRQR